MGGMGGGAGMASAKPSWEMPVEVYGVIYLYNPVSIKRLGLDKVNENTEISDKVETPAASPEAGQQPAAQQPANPDNAVVDPNAAGQNPAAPNAAAPNAAPAGAAPAAGTAVPANPGVNAAQPAAANPQ